MAGGVTTSRDMGNDNTRLQEIISRDAGDRGSAQSSRAASIEGDSPYSASGGFRVKAWQGARDAVGLV